MNKCFFLVIISLLVINSTNGQTSCKVKKEELSISYIGKCKKGYAHGKGEAKGVEDFYAGNFKKGLPHGFGVYTWGNGNTYKGSFVKGKMDGKGVLSLVKPLGGIDIKSGYFKRNKYLGKYKSPYRVISKREVQNVYFQENPKKITGELHEIIIKIKTRGGYVSPVLNISDANGSNTIRRNGNTVFTNVKFPCNKIEISFTHDGFSSRVVLDVYKEGNWIIEITI